MTLNAPENFIAINYQSVEFLIPKAEVIAAGCFNDGENNGDEIDFDALVNKIMGIEQSQQLGRRTSVILNDKMVFSTSSDCKVKQIPLSKFSVFSDSIAHSLKDKGIIACSFLDADGNPVDSNLGTATTIRYIINAENFIKRALW
ncbi:MAG: hypothetical protein K6G52_00040 [Treponemataceae bacterium]|nr:hypothetical protein [Treponemataceae bacterium]